jgi:hypothetical protein
MQTQLLQTNCSRYSSSLKNMQLIRCPLDMYHRTQFAHTPYRTVHLQFRAKPQENFEELLYMNLGWIWRSGRHYEPNTRVSSISCLTHCITQTDPRVSTVIPRLTKRIRSGNTFVSRNVISHRLSGVSLLAVSNVNNTVGLVGLPYVMWSAHFFVTHVQTGKISSWNGPTVHVCCFVSARIH